MYRLLGQGRKKSHFGIAAGQSDSPQRSERRVGFRNTDRHILGGHDWLEYTFQPSEVGSLTRCWRRLRPLRFRSADRLPSRILVSIRRPFIGEGETFPSSAEMFDLNICKQEENRLRTDQYIEAGPLFLLQEHWLQSCAVIFALILFHRSEAS